MPSRRPILASFCVFARAFVGCAAVLVANAGGARGDEDVVRPEPKAATWSGQGLAAKYELDRGIAADPRVVLHDSFETRDLSRRWQSVEKFPGQIEFVAAKDSAADVHNGEQALRIRYQRGKNTGGHLYTSFAKGHERLFFRFYVRFPRGHGYVHHFVHLAGYRPPTPWPQGGAGDRPRGDERFSSGIDLYGDYGAVPAPGRWGLYSYWCEMQGSPGRYWGNEPAGGKRILAVTDRWTCVELMVKVNEVGQRDGEQAFWIDGECAGHWTGYRWRTDDELRVNAAWLLYYITDDAVRRGRGELKDESVLFDDIVVATEYIGPLSRAPEPAPNPPADRGGAARNE